MIGEVTREAVLAAIRQCDELGRDRFRAVHGYGRASAYEVTYRRRRYDSKAIVGVAYGLQHGVEPLAPAEFSGGVEHSARRLVRLGFTVRRDQHVLTPDDVAIPQRLSRRPVAGDLRLYVCRPTNARSVAACYGHDFGTLISPLSVRTRKDKPPKLDDLSGHTEPLERLPYVLDNGVWSCHAVGEPWRERPFLQLLERHGAGSTFAVVPDIIGAGDASLEFSLAWWRAHRTGAAANTPSWLLAVQDGMAVDRVRAELLEHGFAGIFVGGSAGKDTPNWKWRTVHAWAELGLQLGLRVHVGRVNGERKAALCRDLGVTSVDGSCVSKFAVNATKMGRSCDGTEDPGRWRLTP